MYAHITLIKQKGDKILGKMYQKIGDFFLNCPETSTNILDCKNRVRKS